MPSSPEQSKTLFVGDLQRELRIGERLARELARRLGRRIGERKWVVTRAALEKYLAEQDATSSSSQSSGRAP